MRSCEVLAPYSEGRVQMRSRDGLTWWQRAQAPAAGWYWWSQSGQALREAEYHELQQLPMRTLQVGKHPLKLAEQLLEGEWIKAWWDGCRGWVIGPCAGPTPPRNQGAPNIQEAVERGGGQFLGAVATQQGWSVSWRRNHVSYISQVDQKLNLLTAGFCLSGLDRMQDLTSLVSLVDGKESLDADSRMWRGDVGW